jgi:hypothetical protein
MPSLTYGNNNACGFIQEIESTGNNPTLGIYYHSGGCTCSLAEEVILTSGPSPQCNYFTSP